MSDDKIRSLVEAEHSKKQTEKIIRYVGNDQQRFNSLLKLSLGKEERLAQCASWPLSCCVEAHPELAKRHLSKLINHLSVPAHHAVHRNIVRLLRYVDIPLSLETKALEACFRIIHSKEELLANKVFAIYAILPLCIKYPDLFRELKTSMDEQIDYQSPGFKSAYRKVDAAYRKSMKSAFNFR